VLRGPAVLIYGGSAIGGRGQRDRQAHSAARVRRKRFTSTSRPRPTRPTTCARAGPRRDVPLGGAVAFHLDGAYRQTDDLDIAGTS
jgi:iron complex outermembrane receptor protein